MMQRIKFILLPVLVILAAAAIVNRAVATPHKKVKYTLEDCQMCHVEEYRLLKDDGKSHWTKLNCLNCHKGHNTDDVRGNIPACSKCHNHSPHFKFTPCSDCHRNAHTPLRLTLKPNVSGPCVPCHQEQASQLKRFPSRHSREECTSCHDKHGKPPGCMECHPPHASGMRSPECLMCHQAHKPLDITYDDSVSTWFCAVCHAKVANFFAQNKSRHSQVKCVSCHKNKHGQIPACVDCHPPHKIMTSREGCTTCHTAHAPLPVKPVVFGPDTPSEKCADCHSSILKVLRAGSTRHHKLECVFCHAGNHGTIPRCQDCHGFPHPKALHEKFPTCGKCHQTAHDLVM